jgi:hypothetical protein
VAAVVQVFQLWTEGIPVGSMRGKLFTRAFFKQHFPNMDPNKIPEGGYVQSLSHLCVRASCCDIVVVSVRLTRCAYVEHAHAHRYPDMGSGLYASKLSHEDWVRFNNAQRAHYNYLEGISLILVLELVAGLFFPRYAALLAFVYIVGRLFYGIGYRSAGTNLSSRACVRVR